MSTSVVAIVGRPNVGKSTLYNRLVGGRSAIEDRQAGVTRDRLYGRANWLGRDFTIIDTGGITFNEGVSLETQIQRQVELAIEEASLILFVVDAIEAITPLDYDIAHYLRKTRKNVLLVSNKVDPGKKSWDWYPLYELGLGEPIPVSAAHGLGTGDLLEKVIEELPPEEPADEELLQDSIKVAVVGRPNVGKSSLINKLIGQEERVIVSDQPGTTRDAIDVFMEYEGTNIVMVDTAGVRRRAKVKEDVEYYSVLRSIKAARRADVVLVVLDASEGFTEQDQRIAGIAHEAGKGIIFIINKWDLVGSEAEDNAVKYIDNLRREFSFANYAQAIFTSALTGRGLKKIFDTIINVDGESKKRISTSLLNELLQDALLVNPPPTKKGQKAKIYYMTQPDIQPPTFILFVNDTKLLHFSYVRYIENRLREAFGFGGVPLKLRLRPKKDKDK